MIGYLINPLLNSLPTAPPGAHPCWGHGVRSICRQAFVRTFCDFLFFHRALEISLRKNVVKMQKIEDFVSQNSPKTLPKPPQIRGSTKDAKFHRFCSNFVACCKSRPSKFVRPANVLLTFHTLQLVAFSTYFGSEKPTQNLAKTTSEPLQDRS